MDALETILSRKSIRHFIDRKINGNIVSQILKAGMSGPSCVNSRDWSFIVVEDKSTLEKMADINGPAANPLREAALGIIVCGDTSRSFQKAPDYWIIDASISAQNMILAAEALGISSCWLGTWPQPNKVEGQRNLFHLPDSIFPHSIIAFGYSDEVKEVNDSKWEQDRIHYEKW